MLLLNLTIPHPSPNYFDESSDSEDEFKAVCFPPENEIHLFIQIVHLVYFNKRKRNNFFELSINTHHIAPHLKTKNKKA